MLKHSCACVKLIESEMYTIVAVSNGNVWYNACTSRQKSSRPWFCFSNERNTLVALVFLEKKGNSFVSSRSFFFLFFNVWNLINRQRRWSVLFKEREDGMKTKKKAKQKLGHWPPFVRAIRTQLQHRLYASQWLALEIRSYFGYDFTPNALANMHPKFWINEACMCLVLIAQKAHTHTNANWISVPIWNHLNCYVICMGKFALGAIQSTNRHNLIEQ